MCNGRMAGAKADLSDWRVARIQAGPYIHRLISLGGEADVPNWKNHFDLPGLAVRGMG